MNTATKTIEFGSFCIEMYARQHKISGAAVARRFEQYGVIDYLLANYEALHTQGWNYIFPLLEEFMAGQEEK
ncbi:MAG: DUF3791 domain-containing protein [Candidatus Margulisbacteria bacterium]|jgi:hypothetical protein|nr:DUF3791 domain-containing protein [Candidatus Margulisiibacteriota bacterium]